MREDSHFVSQWDTECPKYGSTEWGRAAELKRNLWLVMIALTR